MYFKGKILLSFFLLFSFYTYAQISNKRCKWIRLEREEFFIDTLSILPSSIKITSPVDSTLKINYDLNTGKSKLVYKSKPDSIFICYSVFPFQLNKPGYHRNPRLLDSNNYYAEDSYVRFKRSPIESREEIFSSPGLNKTGSISRGISFGNNQNVFVNSVLNLQLEGKLTDDISITAAISDQNIPFQPQGNTQQLQDFDKVYVQLKSKTTTVTAGDVVFRNKPSNFLRFYKNVQGAQAEVNYQKDSSVYSTTTGGIAIAKGKFATMLFAKGQPDQPIEGVQGPYRLKGPNNEPFITVLANSEKVYLDGRLLTRGFDFDYIIDYNQAEVTFTNAIMITQYSVIRIDYEYTDRNYSRMIVHGSHYQNIGRANAYVNFYEEKDNPRNPLTLTLEDSEKILLSKIGDTLTKAYISGADSIGYNTTQIMYKKTTGGIYVYSTNPDSAFYQVTFSDVGQGSGSYIQSTAAVNGRVYVFVGSGNGRYEPVKTIPTPRLKQMVTLGGGYQVGKNDKVFFELARSNQDLNLFSPYDDQDNGGTAYKGGYINTGRRVKFLKDYNWTGSFDYEYNAKTFVPIDRFRDPNFERDWSSDPNAIADNHIINGSFGLSKDQNHMIGYRVSRRIHGTDVDGVQHYLTLVQNFGKLNVTGNGFLMFNNRNIENSDWRRLFTSISYKTRYFTPGVGYNMDKNKVITDSTSMVSRSAMYYDEVKAFVKSNDTLKIRFFSDFAIREDQAPINGILQRSTRAQTSNSGLNTRIGQNNELATTVTYRYLEYFNNASGTKLPNEENILGRVDFNSNLLNKHVRSEFTLTTGTGRELKRQFVYIPVPVGEGSYYWKDLNNDGVQDLNEFFEAVYTSDKLYIKSYIPTDQYIKAYTNTLSYRLDVTAPRTWRDKGKVKSFLSKFSNVTSWTLNKKITDPSLASRFLPIINSIPSDQILSVQKTVRSALFFNRSNPKYGMDFNYSFNEGKQYLTQGFETKITEDLKWNGRLNIKQYANVKLSLLKGYKSNASDFLASRNYDIDIKTINPEISYQPKNNFRLTLLASYTIKQNIKLGSNHERLDFYQAGTELKITKVSQRTINGTFKYIRINPQWNGTLVNSAIAYEMLEALLPGDNFTWNVTWQERLSNGLQLSFTYEGRKSQTSDVIHIGRMQVSALF
jgi:hypothetical protein